jgi:hypothetical protein
MVRAPRQKVLLEGHVSDVVDLGDVGDVDLIGEPPLLGPRARRTIALMPLVVAVPAGDPVDVIDAPLAVMDVVPTEHRIVTESTSVGVPGTQPPAVRIAIEVAVVVVAVIRAHPEMHEQVAHVQSIRGPVEVSRPGVERLMEVNRSV